MQIVNDVWSSESDIVGDGITALANRDASAKRGISVDFSVGAL